MRAYDGRHFRFRVTVQDLGVPARSVVGTVSIVFNETCAVADRRRTATPEREANDTWHSVVVVLVVSALFGTGLGLSIVAISRRLRLCRVDLLGTVSTPRELARRPHPLRGDATCLCVEQNLRFVVTDDATEITIVSRH